MKVILAFSILLFLGFSRLVAEEAELSVKAEIDKSVLTVGERLEYKITVTHDPRIQITPQWTPPSDAFDLKEAHDFSEKAGKQIAEGRRFILTAYELGEFILEPVAIRYRTADGKEKTIETNRLYLTVQSVDAGTPKTDIRGSKGVLTLKARWGRAVLLLLVLFCFGGGIFVWRWWTNRSQGSPVEKEPPLSPEDEALLKLSRLFDSDLIRQGKVKDYFLQLSQILRFYFERRFSVAAVELTTSETLESLHRMGLPNALEEKIRRVLDSADLAKFAKWAPSPTEITQLNQGSKQIIEEARPKPDVSPAIEPDKIKSALHGV